MPPRPARRTASFLSTWFLFAALPALAQVAPPAAPDTPAAPPAPPAIEGASTGSPPAPGSQKLDKVEITGGRANEMSERRQSTAAKIIIGRDEIERFGDSTLGEVLKRLPGVTLQGPPGRGGNIRMRGLGSGYTQILIDGERVPPGFSIDSLTPEQIERIEILRAPTAETGARAIAGTLNIITREGFRKRLNNLRAGFAYEGGEWDPGFSWTRNDSVDNFIYNVSLSAFRFVTKDHSVNTGYVDDTGPNAGSSTSVETTDSLTRRTGLHANGRLQWRGDKGSSLVVMPMVVSNEISTRRNSVLDYTSSGFVPPDPRAEAQYRSSALVSDGRYNLFRLNGQWNQQIAGAGRVELKGGAGRGKWSGRVTRNLFDLNGAAQPADLFDDINTATDDNVSAGLKYTGTLSNEHSLVFGAEAENNKRGETHTDTDDSGDTFSARSKRFAVYGQDEWNLSPQWAVHAGLRWEGITVQSDAVQTGSSLVDITNRSSVWTPLFHAVWKPDPKSRDQVRMSLTRSYKSPTLQTVIARPFINPRYSQTETNTPTTADRAGNPNLKPELATGIDLAVERYLEGNGILSANFFHREISDYMRSVVELETVSWATQPRYVARTRNVGDAMTRGLELEAKFRFSDLWPDAPPVDFRANGSLFQSRVKGVPGPDNRLDQQPGGTLNIGADYRFRGTPVTIGGNYNWTPGYTTRLSETQWAIQGRKTSAEAYVLYVFNPAAQVRFTANNMVPNDYITGSRYESPTLRESGENVASTYINWQLRVELKL
jgi:outer membrane receptor for ferrienterochelin and colicins